MRKTSLSRFNIARFMVAALSATLIIGCGSFTRRETNQKISLSRYSQPTPSPSLSKP